MSIMGRHKEWRKVAKRERRRKLRIKHALQNNAEVDIDQSSEEYKTWIQEQEYLENFKLQEIARQNAIQNEKWKRADERSVKQWEDLQKKLELTRLRNLEQEIKIQKEWENEQIRVKEAQERFKQIEDENRVLQQNFMDQLEQFLSGNNEAPAELFTTRETKPTMALCPFFVKTACCRFSDLCSRNHQYPGISKILLASNFYTHFGLENSSVTEYEDDVMLEYEDSDTYKHFKEFFFDVLPEFQKYGEVVEFKVCHNYEKHLRGNTYIEFSKLRFAVAAYRGLHTRWYGGKQLSLQFCNISSWNNAICGLQISKRCPKGRACNFLHVFRNPRIFRPSSTPRRHRHSERERERESSWRWSPSPEPETKDRRKSNDTRDTRRDRRKECSPKYRRSKSRRD